MGGIVAFDFLPCGAPVLDFLALHHRPLADFHRGADPHAHHVRHAPQNHAGSPAADQDVSMVCQFEDFLGRVVRQALAAGSQALEQRGAAFEKVMDGALPHMQVLGDRHARPYGGEQP